jgi:hypothetical protein
MSLSSFLMILSISVLYAVKARMINENGVVGRRRNSLLKKYRCQ